MVLYMSEMKEEKLKSNAIFRLRKFVVSVICDVTLLQEHLCEQYLTCRVKQSRIMVNGRKY